MLTTSGNTRSFQYFFILRIALICPPATALAQSLQFDGGDYARIPSSPSLQLAQSFTFEAWIRATANESIILSKDDASAEDYVFYVGRNGELSLNLQGRGTWRASSVLPLHIWIHVAASYDGSMLKFYVEGEQTDLFQVAGSLVQSTRPLDIGVSFFGPDEFMRGAIADLRIFNVARTAEEIRCDRVSIANGDEFGLVGYWRFDEQNGQSIIDRSPFHNDGALGTNNSLPDAADPTWSPLAPLALVPVIFPNEQALCPRGAAVLQVSHEDSPLNEIFSWQVLHPGNPATWLDLQNGDYQNNGQTVFQVSGADTATISISAFTLSVQRWSFRALFTNDCGTLTTTIGTLSVCVYSADLDCDGDVDLPDLAVLLGNFGREDSPPYESGNVDRDQDVDLQDLAYVLGDFGSTCSP